MVLPGFLFALRDRKKLEVSEPNGRHARRARRTMRSIRREPRDLIDAGCSEPIGETRVALTSRERARCGHCLRVNAYRQNRW
jgi:hypothetical protein